MPDKAIISHRGEKYEIGRGRRFYGIWVIGAPYDAPVDRWPESRDGWGQAWARFAAIEKPESIVAVPRQRAGRWRGRGGGSDSAGAGAGAGEGDGDSAGAAQGAARSGTGGPAARRSPGALLLAAEGLLVLGVAAGLVGLFPAYLGGQHLLSQGYQVFAHLCYLVAWAASAGLVALGVVRRGSARYGALFGLGLSAVTLGLLAADVGAVAAGGTSAGAGLVLTLAGWAGCTAGAALALAATRGEGRRAVAAPAHPAPAGAAPGTAMPGGTEPGRPALPGRGHWGPFALLLLAGIGTATAFAPAWDSYTLAVSRTGTAQTITAGNAFDVPGPMIAGNVAVMAAVVAVAVLAALWRPARQGAALLGGAVAALAAQAISALIQISEPATPAMFGISRGQAAAAGLTITSGVTPVFWVFCVFVISLIASCAWLFTSPAHPAMPVILAPWPPAPQGPGGPAGGETAAQNTAGPQVGDAEGGDAERAEAEGERAEAEGGGAESGERADSEGGAADGERSAYA